MLFFPTRKRKIISIQKSKKIIRALVKYKEMEKKIKNKTNIRDK
jgi:hypothetical protein